MREETLTDSVRRHARERAAAPAIVFEGATLRYAELDRRADAVASGLAHLAPQARIAILDVNRPHFLEITIGAQRARSVLVGINTRLAAPEIAFILADAEAEVAFVAREFYATLEAHAHELPRLRQIVALDGGHPRWPDYASWRDAASAASPGAAPDPDEDIIQVYTSGTTGRPKGVCHTHRTWGASARLFQSLEPDMFGTDSAFLACMPLFHVAGFSPACVTLMHGGTIVLMRRIDPHEILTLLETERISTTILVPAVILAVVHAAQGRRFAFPHLRALLYGASPISQELLRQARALFGCGFFHLYGQTENGGAATCLPASGHDPALGKLRSCGRPYAGVELKILDPEGNVVATGEVGEIAVRSAGVMRGYWKQDEATRATIRDGWLLSGDAGYVDGDGYLYIHDRVKDMIKTGSEKVYPAEVENALYGHPAIADVAAIGVPDERWGEAVKAIVVLKPGATLDVEDILAYARARIGGFKLPKSIEAIAELPRNASGKILRRVLREKYWADRERGVN